MPYVFDTSSFQVLTNYYPEHFPTFWERFDKVVASGEAFSVREVHRELEFLLKDRWIAEWIDKNKAIFRVPTGPETEFVAEIFTVPHFQALVGQKQRLRGSPVADPFIVASARVCGGCVVTEEVMKKEAAKIPNVCAHFGVSCTNVAGFLEQKGWKF
jgi:hypothetical protein